MKHLDNFYFIILHSNTKQNLVKHPFFYQAIEEFNIFFKHAGIL